jgi:DNA-binding MarR family transcriptional regulator
MARHDPSSSLRFGPLVTLIGFFLRRAQLAVYEDFRRDAPLAVTPGQLGMLVVIAYNQGLMQQDICEGIGVDKSTFAIALHGLARRKLVRRVQSKQDRRRNMLQLTPKGEKALATMLAHAAAHERRMFATLSASERGKLMTLLKKVAPE